MADYSINYNDPKFQQVETEKQAQLNQMNNTYNNMISQSDKFYQDQINANNEYQKTQTDLQNQQTDLAIERIENEKAKVEKDYQREQRGAYVDYQKATDQFGANAEQRASAGLSNMSGTSESAQIAAWSAYQNRYSTARESYNQAVTDYNLGIKDAQLQNSAVLAEIAFNTLQSNLQLGLQGFQYKNDLLQQQMKQQQQINSEYYSRWQDVLNQMNRENEFKYQQERDRIADAQWQKEYNLSVANSKRSSSGGGSSSIQKDTDLSKSAKELLDKLRSTQPTSSGNTWLSKTINTAKSSVSKEYIANTLNKEWKNGNITDAELEYMASKLGY